MMNFSTVKVYFSWHAGIAGNSSPVDPFLLAMGVEH